MNGFGWNFVSFLFHGFLWRSQAKTLGISLLVGEGQKLHFDQ